MVYINNEKKSIKLFVIVIFAGLALHIPVLFQGCQTNVVELINGWGHDVHVVLRAEDENGDILLDRVLSSDHPYVVGVDLSSYGDASYYISVRNTLTDELLTGTFGYVVYHYGHKDFFLIKSSGIYHTSWSMFDSGVVGTIRHIHHFLTNGLSCII